MPEQRSADALVEHLRRTLAARAGDPDAVLLHERAEPAHAATPGVLRPRLPPPLARALVSRGVQQLYAHQVAAVEHLRAGHNLVLASPTASGKSLAFALPTLERVLDGGGRHALYIYPTKALIGDQLRALRELIAALPIAQPPRVAVLTGDTPRDERADLARQPPAILLANPDILHHSLLPDHRRWQRLLGGLDVVVLDELHAYRGVFGAHVALVLRRLRRLAGRYGATPRFVAASATISNPVELAEQVVGAPFTEVQGDAAGTGPRRFLFWRPPLRGDPLENEHESVLSEAAALFAASLQAGYSGILFGRARVSVERMLLDVRRLVGPGLAEQVSAYKSGYRTDERAAIEAGLRSGRLRGVVSTNALELGIDVGALDVAVLAGYPGSTMSFWQQAGRVGRRPDREAVVVLVAGDDALDQYQVQHPEAFFGRTMEHAAVDPGNAAILLGHLLCAASEQPLDEADLALLPPNARGLITRLTDAGELSDGPPWTATGRPAHTDVALRGTSREPYTLQAPHGPLGTIEPPHLQRECFPGAVYLHNGRGYRVSEVVAGARVVRLEPAALDVRTDPLLELEVAPRGAPAAEQQVGPFAVAVGPLRVREAVVGYREQRRGQSSTLALASPFETVLDTVGLWLDVPPALEPDRGALHAFEHALVNALPLALLCDRRDVGSTSDGLRVYLFDFVDGGIGLVDKAFHLLPSVLERAAGLVRECPCSEGCPNCVHLAGCADANNELDKMGGQALLEGRSVSAARAAARLLRPQTARAADRARGDRRRRLRDIADADRRARFGARDGASEVGRVPDDGSAPIVGSAGVGDGAAIAGPGDWLRVGSLAWLAGQGVVLVSALDERGAQVTPLGGGDSTTVPVSALEPPRAG